MKVRISRQGGESTLETDDGEVIAHLTKEYDHADTLIAIMNAVGYMAGLANEDFEVESDAEQYPNPTGGGNVSTAANMGPVRGKIERSETAEEETEETDTY